MLHSCYLMVMSQSVCSKIKKCLGSIKAKSIDVTLFHSPTQHLTTFKWLFDASLCFYLHPHHLSQIYSIVSSIGPLYMYVKTNKTREIYENGRNLELFLLLDDFPVLLLPQQKIICSGQKYPPISIVQNFIAKGIRSPDPCQARWMVCRAHYQVGIVQYTQQCRLAH